jgi:hypothetical protein
VRFVGVSSLFRPAGAGYRVRVSVDSGNPGRNGIGTMAKKRGVYGCPSLATEKQFYQENIMNKKQAEFIVKALSEIMTGRRLTSTQTIGHERPRVRTNQRFEKAYIVDYKDGSCVVAVCDSYGVMTGAENWNIDPDSRSIFAETKNGLGETVHFSWTVEDDDGSGKLWLW